MALFEIGAAFSVNFIMLVTMRFLVGVFTAGARNSAFVYGMQFCMNLCYGYGEYDRYLGIG